MLPANPRFGATHINVKEFVLVDYKIYVARYKNIMTMESTFMFFLVESFLYNDLEVQEQVIEFHMSTNIEEIWDVLMDSYLELCENATDEMIDFIRQELNELIA